MSAVLEAMMLKATMAEVMMAETTRAVAAGCLKASLLACLAADQYEQNHVDQASERGGDGVADSPTIQQRVSQKRSYISFSRS
jgi:hypothetical protein